MSPLWRSSNASLVAAFGDTKGAWIAVLSFFSGVLIIALIDKLIPSYENPHEIKRIEEVKNGQDVPDPRLVRMGLFTALAIAIHNFPEGIATFFAGLSEPELAICSRSLFLPSFLTGRRFPTACLGTFSAQWQGSWCSSPSTNCFPRQKNMDITTIPSMDLF
jgi:hypothetical protein